MFMREIDSSPDGLQRTRPSHKRGGFFTGEGGGKKNRILGIPPMIWWHGISMVVSANHHFIPIDLPMVICKWWPMITDNDQRWQWWPMANCSSGDQGCPFSEPCPAPSNLGKRISRTSFTFSGGRTPRVGSGNTPHSAGRQRSMAFKTSGCARTRWYLRIVLYGRNLM